MDKRRNVSQREVIADELLDVSGLMRGSDADDQNANAPLIGGETDAIGVPANIELVEQEIILVNDEYRVNVVLEFDAVPGADSYDSVLVLSGGTG